jgi:hypothetical protein
LSCRADLGLPSEEFLFLFMFDFLSVYERKNPLAAIRAFKKCFKHEEPVRLILKCINSQNAPERVQEMQKEIGNAKITLMDQYLSSSDTTAIIAACDSYVSLHRSEGLGLPLVEAMLQRKPVIATGWSGNSDFMTAQNSYPLPYKLVLNHDDAPPYRAGEQWAEADIDAAVRAMRDVYSNRDDAALKAAQAAVDASAIFSEETIASLMRDRLLVSQTFSPILLQHSTNSGSTSGSYSVSPLVEQQLSIISSGKDPSDSSAQKTIIRKLLMSIVERAGYLGSIYSQLLRRLFVEASELRREINLVDNRTRRQMVDTDARIRALEEEINRLQQAQNR